MHVTGVKEAMTKHSDTSADERCTLNSRQRRARHLRSRLRGGIIDYVPERPKRTPKAVKKPTPTNATGTTDDAAANATKPKAPLAKDDKEGDDVNATEATEDAKSDAETTAEAARRGTGRGGGTEDEAPSACSRPLA